MSPPIHSSLVFKFALEFYLSFARYRFKRHFIISDVSAGNTTLCRGQNVALKLRIGDPAVAGTVTD
jgi:hypothetical protein